MLTKLLRTNELEYSLTVPLINAHDWEDGSLHKIKVVGNSNWVRYYSPRFALTLFNG